MGKGGKGGKGSSRLRAGSWNIGTLTGKSIELGKILHKKGINIACVQETRWKATRVWDANGFKLWYSGGAAGKNVIGGPGRRGQRRFWDNLDEVIRSIPHSEKLVIGGDFYGHIGVTARDYDEVHGGFDFGVRNEGSTSLLGFAKAFDLVL
uniref:Craniofacial development protein 2-like n=1 Tax=Nicotiana tabacum TaxID=4097 RepID=A0A1S3XG94_TOBAC|nr:PREDICTED: uncharacterized protein LOC107764741 [Nicotiana tabacum]